MALASTSLTALADDGELIRRSMSSAPGQPPEYACESEGEHAFINMMNFYVPSQNAAGELVPIEYYNADGVLVETREKAKPLISVFVYGPVLSVEGAAGFPGHGRRDAYAAVSLDDGLTWKRTNLSESADMSSFTVSTPLPDPGTYCGEVPIDWNSAIVAADDAAASFVADLDKAEASSAQPPDPGTYPVPEITEATWEDLSEVVGLISVAGMADPNSRIRILGYQSDPATAELLGIVNSDETGAFSGSRRLQTTLAPCFVQAQYAPNGDLSEPFPVAGAPNCEPAIPTITEYPGDVNNIVHATAENKVIVAWQSTFCQQGSPAYTLETTGDLDAVASYLGIDVSTDLYLTDLFAVAGSQGSIDYATEGFPQVGEVPFHCLWTARGVLMENEEVPGTTEVVWFQAERLTSGRRDVNRIEIGLVAGAGAAVTWQEDPVGLRPGEGEGAGEGWAGATTNSQTDIWYSFLPWEHFDIVDDEGSPVPLPEYTGDTKPKPYVPFAVPMRLTNNARCQTDATEGYCSDIALGYGLKDQCIDTVEIPLGPQGTLQPVCVVDSNASGAADPGDMPNVANTAASRARLSVQPRDSDGDGVTDDAWVMVFNEEDKGLGRFGFPNDVAWTGNLDDTAEPCGDPDTDREDNCIEADIGKNIWWHSFAMGDADTSASDGLDYGLVENLVGQGDMVNQPEVNWITGTFYPPMSTEDMWDFGDYDFLIFNTEIARRSSMMAQSLTNALSGEANLVALPLWKQGTVRQGGPADIMGRRFVVAEDIDQATQNPYAFENMECAWYDGLGNVYEGIMFFEDGSNPYYPHGLCTAPAINLSAITPYQCEVTGSSDGVCPGAADMVCEETEFGQWCLTTTDPEDIQTFDRLLSWYQCPGSNGSLDGLQPPCFQEPDSLLLESNLDDQAWYMPLDISKAHRGFLNGDQVMMLYAMSPNYKLNAVGRDRYELYTRRSFDGGVTWTTTPNEAPWNETPFTVIDGTVTCETWRDGATDPEDSHVCTEYAAGEPEQARNLSQLRSTRFTILDPRYTPTRNGIVELDLSAYGTIFNYEPIEPTDIPNPSRHFIVYETGDNTTTILGEPEAEDLFYGRAINWGDDFVVWADEVLDPNLTLCYPTDPHDDPSVDENVVGSGFCNEFDDLEGRRDSLSEEASITSSAWGDFLYAVWGQFNVMVDEETGEEVFVDGDAMFRRVWWIDGYIPTEAWTLPGTQQPAE